VEAIATALPQTSPYGSEHRNNITLDTKDVSSMAEATNGSAITAGPNTAQIQVRIINQYIKDLSFENPNIERFVAGPGSNPNLKLEITVNAQRLDEKIFESAITMKAQATNETGIIYDLECIYAGMFQVEGLAEAQLEPFLLIHCPTLIFPFQRRLVADITREGGFPPLLIDPIDFGALYAQKRQGGTETALS
jgi:preprotein translocase subunit SecB